jgi:transcriptional regulator with XRE-family HTH domain
MDIKKEFGLRVRELRKSKGLSQEQLGFKAKLHFTYIGAVERAEKNITLESITKIAKGLEVDIPTLFYFAEQGKGREEIITQIMKEVSVKKPGQLKTILRIVRAV